MRAIDERLALQLVEEGTGLAPLDQALLLVSSVEDLPAESAAELAVDERDAKLIAARIAAFGAGVTFFTPCPHCGEGNEADFDLNSIPRRQSERIEISIDGRPICLRPPSSRAVAAAAAASDPKILLHACAEGVGPADDPRTLERIEQELASAFPLLNITFDMTCAQCSREFTTRFDIGAWLWREVEALADQAVDTVDRLARAYGWSESDILAMPQSRRALYLARVTA